MIEKISKALRSNLFFYGIVVLFVLEAGWIALSSHFPMAFDENFHFGIIKLYAHHWSPWWDVMPVGGETYGAMIRDPSYLYHWLMSFPYRLISQLTHDTTQQVIILRFMNIAIFAAGLFALRALLNKATKSRTAVNLVLLFLVLTPVIPMLAGQINYDNLLFLLVPIALLMMFRFIENLRTHKRFDILTLGWLAVLCMLSSLVKYAFVPVGLVIVVYLLWNLVKTYRLKQRHLGKDLASGWRGISLIAKIGLIAGLLVSAVLFSERYVVNTVRYHTPIPECNQILSRDECLFYGPWARNYRSQQTKLNTGVYDKFTLVTYIQHWFFILWRSHFYILNGPDSGYIVGEPLLLPLIASVAIFTLGVFYLLRWHRQIFSKNKVLKFLTGLLIVYSLILFYQNYSDYLNVGQAVAIQGRYLLPILPILYLLLVLGIGYGLRNYQKIKLGLLAITILFFVQGGGFVTYLVRADDRWYISNSMTSRINKATQPVIKVFVIGD